MKRVVWERSGVSLELADLSGGHAWEEDEGCWRCNRCEWTVLSDVPPEHPNFPGSINEKFSWIEDCDVEIAKNVHQS